VTAVGHDQRHVISACFHHVSDKGVAETVTGEAVGSAVVEVCQSRCFAACPRYGIVKGRGLGAWKQQLLVGETFPDSALSNLFNAIP
jgi:hypothetical protein